VRGRSEKTAEKAVIDRFEQNRKPSHTNANKYAPEVPRDKNRNHEESCAEHHEKSSAVRLKRIGRDSALNQPKDSTRPAVMKMPGVIVANDQA